MWFSDISVEEKIEFSTVLFEFFWNIWLGCSRRMEIRVVKLVLLPKGTSLFSGPGCLNLSFHVFHGVLIRTEVAMAKKSGITANQVPLWLPPYVVHQTAMLLSIPKNSFVFGKECFKEWSGFPPVFWSWLIRELSWNIILKSYRKNIESRCATTQ